MNKAETIMQKLGYKGNRPYTPGYLDRILGSRNIPMEHKEKRYKQYLEDVVAGGQRKAKKGPAALVGGLLGAAYPVGYAMATGRRGRHAIIGGVAGAGLGMLLEAISRFMHDDNYKGAKDLITGSNASQKLKNALMEEIADQEDKYRSEANAARVTNVHINSPSLYE